MPQPGAYPRLPSPRVASSCWLYARTHQSALGVGVLGTDLIAEEVRRLAGGVCYQRLGSRQLQLQFLAQERRDPRLNVPASRCLC